MQSETKIHSQGSVSTTCQNCKKDFIIESDDFLFYEKIKVPPPTFCPECRMIARFSFRSQTSLHKRDCDMCKISIVSMYSKDKKFPVYCHDCFYGDKWDAESYGQDIDFKRPFFEQFYELMLKTPRIALIGTNKINSELCIHCSDIKNCYLCFSIGNSENCYYMGPQIVNDKNCSSCSMTRNSEWCYMLVDCEQCYRVSYSQNSINCIESTFLYDCRNCQNCLGCVNLRNKSYCILNEQYKKEEYFEKKKELLLDNHEKFEEFRILFNKLKKNCINKYSNITNSNNCTGDNIINSQNCNNCFVLVDSENTKYGYICSKAKESMDVTHVWPSSEFSYYSISPINSNKIYFSSFSQSGSFDTWYCDNCFNSNNCFGSISLKNKSYYIFNKKYNKEEYESLVLKIKDHMNKMPYLGKHNRIYRFGDFFPFEISPFTYNESVLQEYFPLTKEEILNMGYLWCDPINKSYKISIKSEDLYNNISDNITKETIGCRHKGNCIHNCSTAFRVLPDEVQIYNALGVPISDLCQNCRYSERIMMRTPFKLWHRSCMKEGCSNEFDTSYAPDRPEIIYCERCYQQEVY